MAKEVSEAVETASYKCGVQEMKIRLADKLAEVCKDYCNKVWLRCSTRQESLLPPSGGALRTFFI